MCFTFIPADRPPVWLNYTPAEKNAAASEGDNIATEGANCADVADETLGVAQNTCEKTAGAPISSVDQTSQLAKREYHRDSIRMRKGRAMLSSLVRRLNTAQEIAQKMNIERAVLKMCGSNLGLSSDENEVIATTSGRCSDGTVVDASVHVDQTGSLIKPRVVASLPLYCRNHRLRCLKNDWLYCPSQAAGSDYLNLRQTTTTAARRPVRDTSSYLSSNLIFDSNKRSLPVLANLAVPLVSC